MTKGSLIAIALALSRPGAAASIPAVPTSTAGFVGMAAKGPLDAPTLVQSAAEFEKVFGPFDPALPAPWLAPSVAAFFANGGER